MKNSKNLIIGVSVIVIISLVLLLSKRNKNEKRMKAPVVMKSNMNKNDKIENFIDQYTLEIPKM